MSGQARSGQEVVTMLAEDRDSLLATVAKVIGQNRRLEQKLECLQRLPTKRMVAASERGRVL
jgi:hypothetical protein